MELLPDPVRELRPNVLPDQVLGFSAEDLAGFRAHVGVLPQVVEGDEGIRYTLEDVLRLPIRSFELGDAPTKLVDFG